MSSETICPVFGSSGTCPAQKTSDPARTAWEYGPMAAGASVVEMIFFMRRSLAAKNPSHNGHKGSQRNPGRKGGHLEFQTLVRLCDLCVRLFHRGTRPSAVVSGRIPSILRAYHGRLDFKENIW